MRELSVLFQFIDVIDVAKQESLRELSVLFQFIDVIDVASSVVK